MATATKCTTLTGIALQSAAEDMTGEQAKEALRALVRVVELEGGTGVVIGFTTIDSLLRKMS